MSSRAESARDPHTESVRRFYDDHHTELENSRRKHGYFYRRLTRMLQARIPAGQRILDIGCGSGHLLAALEPAHGVGLDISARTVARARELYPDERFTFLEGDGGDRGILKRLEGPFDAVLLVNVITHQADVQTALEAVASVCHSRTRIFIYSYSRLWQPLIRLAETLRLKHPPTAESWLPPEEVAHMLYLADYEVIRRDYGILCPVYVPLLADALNRFAARLPVMEWFCLMWGFVVRRTPRVSTDVRAPTSVSVVIPCRNEAGHIPSLVKRLPQLAPGSEFLFVEGNSADDTEGAIRRALADHPELPARYLKQPGKGKGDAVRWGFSQAKGEVLVILDGDMGVAPEDVPKFVAALAQGKGEFINGSRLVYPMEQQAMRFLNLLANKFFAALFSWLLGQQVRDTLCGTKVLYRRDYERIAHNRSFFGDFDPFGDFDLLFGAARLNMHIVDLAVRYHERDYGQTNISRFRHGLLLLRMSLFAASKLKFL